MGALESLAGAIGSALNRFSANDTSLAPQALAEITPSLSNGWFYGNSGVDLIDHHATYGELYRTQPSVTAVVNKRADALARLPINVWDTSSPRGRRDANGTPLGRLLSDPTGGMMSPFAFWTWLSSTFDVYGECFILKMRDADGNVARLNPMTPTRVTVKRDQQGDVVYEFTLGVASTGLMCVSADDVIPLLRFNPDSIMRGLSRLEPLRQTLANEDAARRATLSAWKNGARPGVFLLHPQQLSQATADRIQRMFNARHAGVDNTGTAAVLDEGMTPQRWQMDMQEMQYIDARKLNLEEVCMVYDTAPATIHALLEKASFTSSVEQMRSLYRDSMPPLLGAVESAFNTHLASEFVGGYEVRFAMDEMLRGDFEVRAPMVVSLVAGGIMTPNEARPWIDLPLSDQPEADELFANQAMQKLGTPVTRTSIAEDAPGLPNTVEPDADQTHGETDEKPVAAPAPTKAMSRKAISLSGRIRAKKSRADMRQAAADAQRKAIVGVMGRQSDAMRSNLDGYGDPDDDADPDDMADDLMGDTNWDDELSSALRDPTAAAVDAFGKSIGGSDFDADDYSDWIDDNCDSAARAMNGATKSRLSDMIGAALQSDAVQQALSDGLDQLSDYLTGARADQASDSRATSLANFGEQAGAKSSGKTSKTWVVNSENPRPTHADLDGETVALDDMFSNGASGPGDMDNLDVDEVAGCTCTLDFSSDDDN